MTEPLPVLCHTCATSYLSCDPARLAHLAWERRAHLAWDETLGLLERCPQCGHVGRYRAGHHDTGRSVCPCEPLRPSPVRA